MKKTSPLELVRRARLAEAGLEELYIDRSGDGHEQVFEVCSQEILPRCKGS